MVYHSIRGNTWVSKNMIKEISLYPCLTPILPFLKLTFSPLKMGGFPPGKGDSELGNHHFRVLLLMAEILHHLGCMKPYKYIMGKNYQPSTGELIPDFSHQLTANAPENRPKPNRKGLYSNHPIFRGNSLVSGRVFVREMLKIPRGTPQRRLQGWSKIRCRPKKWSSKASKRRFVTWISAGFCFVKDDDCFCRT